MDGALPPGAGSENVIVGPELSDDAAVVRLPTGGGQGRDGEGPRLVLTTDTIAPLVDEPEAFGAIAAANALSDVWAMGGHPLWALNLVFFPEDKLPLSILRRIMEGARHKCAEANVAIVGGHTVRNGDLKFGLAVTGMLDPTQRRPLANTRALPGQLLVLSKAIGTGVIGSAIKRGAANEDEIKTATASMMQLNDKAAAFAREHGSTSCTDVTGFGLLGHLRNILRGSRLQARIDLHRLPILPGAMRLLEAGFYPGGSKSNLEHLDRSLLRRHSSNDKDAIAWTMLAADAQTSGGLLICVRPEGAERVHEQLRASGHKSAIIGELLPARPIEIGLIELRSGR